MPKYLVTIVEAETVTKLVEIDAADPDEAYALAEEMDWRDIPSDDEVRDSSITGVSEID